MSLRETLLRILGEKRYLSTLSSTFQVLHRNGWLNKSFYRDVYFLREHIRPGDVCIDIGAHLGYYTFELSRLVGPSGSVYAVEPISKFNAVIEAHMGGRTNIHLLKVALGGDSDTVEMGIPQVGARKRFAYAKIIEKTDDFNYVETERIRNEDPNTLFGNLPKIDFIKCDVEGFEVRLFTKMLPTVAKYRPRIVCELLSTVDRADLARLVAPLGYGCYALEGGRWHKIDAYSDVTYFPHNYYFLTAEYARDSPLVVHAP
ncbi:MAG TPA: FkbM family methyltransferase [Dinghuibacter sp.]|jgi:FkbM family methyltransferase|uniref:FkbM family methyltransferase n=1 Tax=Dinghuibacter sp. TaxID=2024697 RepID=UPI002C09376F|nr:FkbM family methyltransferase [Dinghuibacter sp.]HTJ11577.1 FkbM family methyltransferase [Dinghuibacter sp.]